MYRKILALYQRWEVSIPKTKGSTRWEDDFKHSDFGGLFEEYLEMGKKQKEQSKKRISTSTKSPEEFSDGFSSQQPFTSRIIYKVEAIDPDFGRPLKLPIRYTLTSSNPLFTQFFEIHPLNGTIHLKKELDRDPPHGFDEWLLTIIAADEDGREDMGSKKNASWLKIIVKDINDLARKDFKLGFFFKKFFFSFQQCLSMLILLDISLKMLELEHVLKV